MTASVRLEWVEGPNPTTIGFSSGTAKDLSVTSPNVVVSPAAPSFNGLNGYARLICTSGAVVAAVGSTVAANSGVVVNAITGPVILAVQPGQTVALLEAASYAVGLNVSDGESYFLAGDGRKIHNVSSLGILFSDDFGGNTLDSTKWDVLPGGLPQNPTLDGNSLTQTAIGTGQNTGMTYDVGNTTASALTVKMGTTANDELWFLSKQIFACTEDITFVYSLGSSFYTNTSVRVGLVEVDPTTGIPLANPNIGGTGNFTNAGGVEVGASTNTTQGGVWAIADSSPNEVVPTQVGSWAAQNKSSPNECLIEFHAEDIIASSCLPDAANARTNAVARVSSQVPNDGKAYKLIIRLRNTGTVATNVNFTLYRVLVADGHEMRVEVASGRGDQNPQKGVATNLTGSSIGTTATTPLGAIFSLSGYSESTTNLAANSSVLSTSRTMPGYGWSKYSAQAVADQPGTLAIMASTDGTNFYPVATANTTAVSGNGVNGYAASLTIPLVAPANSGTYQYKAWFQNTGAATQTWFRLTSAFSHN